MGGPSHLKSLQALELAIRTGSLRAAADALAITPAAVGQRVKALEDYLGVELVMRGRSGLAPTRSLEAALPHLSAAFQELEAAAALLDLQRGHEIHVSATPDFASLWLKPRIAAFKAAHPQTYVCINGEGADPLRPARVDCDIRFGPPSEAGDVLFHDFVLPIASPDMGARLAGLIGREQLEGFPLLHLDFYRDDAAAPDWPAWIARQKLERSAPERGIRFRRIMLVLDAVLAGAGLAICGLALVSELVEDGRLSLPFPVSTGARTAHAFQARFRAEALARPQVKRFRDWLHAEGASTASWLSSRT